jgi:hypothetical protein
MTATQSCMPRRMPYGAPALRPRSPVASLADVTLSKQLVDGCASGTTQILYLMNTMLNLSITTNSTIQVMQPGRRGCSHRVMFVKGNTHGTGPCNNVPLVIEFERNSSSYPAPWLLLPDTAEATHPPTEAGGQVHMQAWPTAQVMPWIVTRPAIAGGTAGDVMGACQVVLV